MPCDTPIDIRNDAIREIGYDYIMVPCGKCPPCLKRRVNDWVFRLLQEEKRSISSHFITLTYDNYSVPLTHNGFMTLDKRDLQLFWKKLRKKQKEHVKYYAVGEYGGITQRPHYHAIVFNVVDIRSIARSWTKRIDGEWNQCGHVDIQSVTGDSIGYVAGYINKGGQVGNFSADDRLKEFSVMSKNLGENYLTPAVKKWHLADIENRNYVTLDGGVRIALPRYYRYKIYDELQREGQRRHIMSVMYDREFEMLENYRQTFGKDIDIATLREQKVRARKKAWDKKQRLKRLKI